MSFNKSHRFILIALNSTPSLLEAPQMPKGRGLHYHSIEQVSLATTRITRIADRFVVMTSAQMCQRQLARE